MRTEKRREREVDIGQLKMNAFFFDEKSALALRKGGSVGEDGVFRHLVFEH